MKNLLVRETYYSEYSSLVDSGFWEKSPLKVSSPLFVIKVISIDENKQIKYEGKRFVDSIGTYNWIMNEKDFNNLKALIDKKFKANYTLNMEVLDLPLTLMNINNKYQVKFKGDCPEEFEKELNHIEMLLLKNANW